MKIYNRTLKQIKDQVRYYGKTRVKKEYDSFAFCTNFVPLSETDLDKLCVYLDKQDYVEYALIIKDCDTMRFDSRGNSGLPPHFMTMEHMRGKGLNDFLFVKFVFDREQVNYPDTPVTEEHFTELKDWLDKHGHKYEVLSDKIVL